MALRKVLLVDDEPGMISFLSMMFEKDDYQVLSTSDGHKALEMIDEHQPQIMICDVNMPAMDGLEVLKKAREKDSELLVIMITAYGSVEVAVQAMKYGAYDYILKPFKIEEMRLVVGKALEKQNLKEENAYLRQELEQRHTLHQMIGQSAPMQKLFDSVQKIAPARSNVLVTGQSGTGKEMVARAIHYLSPQKDKHFVAVNCSSLPESLLESELFGHVKGSFTGAHKDKKGLLLEADGGTFFLDEIGDMPLALQAKLLRVLQEKELRPVGSTKDIPVDLRVIAATNKDLKKEIQSGNFREDLYFRLGVIPLEIPTLKDRLEDLPLLIEHFLERYSSDQPKTLSKQAQKALYAYTWPGNVRELENVIERAVILSESSTIEASDLNVPCGSEAFQEKEDLLSELSGSLKERLDYYEKEEIVRTLGQEGGNQLQAAKKLGLTRQGLQYKLKKYGLR